MIETSSRCFIRPRDDGKPCGLWIMTRQSGYRGIFFHTEHQEIQPPQWSVEDLEKGAIIGAKEISPDELISKLTDWWPDAVGTARRVFDRHPADEFQA